MPFNKKDVTSTYIVIFKEFDEGVPQSVVRGDEAYQGVVRDLVSQGRIHWRVRQVWEVPVRYNLPGIHRGWEHQR